ncbi:MAG TPA: hypothetical protein VIY48_10620 [Candidatus Paceibacterota bacterium]
MVEVAISGHGFIDQVSFNPLRLKVTAFGRADQLDQSQPIRYMELGWLAGFEQFTDGNNLEQSRYIGPLHWIMFDHQTIDWRPEFDGGGYDGVAYSLRPNVTVIIFF